MAKVGSLTTFVAKAVAVAADVNGNFAALKAAVNSIDDEQFAPGAGMYTAYRTLQTVSSYVADTDGAGDHAFGPSQIIEDVLDGASITPQFIYLAGADYAISGRTPKLRVRAQCYNNATPSTVTYMVALHPMSAFAGGADNQQFTLGSFLAGSSVAFASPSGSTRSEGNSGDFNFPSDGHYALGVSLSGFSTPNARALISAQLQLHWT